MEITSFFYPKFCLGCGKVGDYICSDCQLQVANFSYSRQPKDTFIWLRYQGLIKKAFHQLKYRFVANLAEELVLLAFKKQSQKTKQFKKQFKNFVVVPIPLYWQKRRWRGFNQAEILAKLVAKQLNLKLETKLIKRGKKTLSQVNLTRKQRQNNLKDAFVVVNKKNIIGKNIIVFDDIYTTGETLKQAKKILKRAGANEVFLMALAG